MKTDGFQDGRKSTASSESDDIDSIEFYKDDCRLPVFTKGRTALRPVDVVELLMSPVPSDQVCSIQPLRVEHHRSFIVDLQSLRNTKDIKCDDMGRWRNNSSDKFYFKVETDDVGDFSIEMADKNSAGSEHVVMLRREYYSLNDGIHI